MERKKILALTGFSVIVIMYVLSMAGLYLRERGYFIESRKIRHYQRFIDFNIPENLDLYYRVSVLERPVGYYHSSIEGHFDDYYYNKTQKMMLLFSEIAEIPLYIQAEMESSHNLDGSLMFQSGNIEINRENIRFHGNVVEKSAIFDIEYRDSHYGTEYTLPDQYLTIDLFSPLNINFGEFILNETYELESFFPHLIGFPQKIYIRMEGLEEITVKGQNHEAYHLRLFDENRALSSHLWVGKDNRILRQTFQEYLIIEQITEEEYSEMVQIYESRKESRTWQALPDLTPLLQGEWLKVFSL